MAYPIDAIGASACLMVAFSDFYESHGPPPSGNARGIVPAHRHGHRNGQQSGQILHFHFVCCRPGGRWGDSAKWTNSAFSFCLLSPWRPLGRYGASSCPMAMFSGFYESPGPPSLRDAHGIAPPHRHGYRNGFVR